MLRFYALTTQTLILPNLRLRSNDSAIVGATITATLYKKPGLTEVADPLFDHLAMADVSGSPGYYSCDIPDTFNPPHGTFYSVVYEGSNGPSSFRLQQPAEVKPLVTR
jgi:hypothetical protein